MAIGSATRTYRYIRVGLVGTMAVIAAAVAVEIAGGHILPSISAYYYTGARSPFVGGLFAASLALMAIAGSGFERMVLNVAAIFAPIIALVPTTVKHGSVAGLQDHCGSSACVPPQYDPDIQTGVYTYLLVGVLAVILLIVLIATKALEWGPTLVVVGTLVVVLAVVWFGWTDARTKFVDYAHLTSAAIFFGLIGIVAIYNAFAKPSTDGRLAKGPRVAPPPTAAKILYITVAVGMTLDLVALIVVLVQKGPIFYCEAVALVLFVTFWVTQTFETVKLPHKDATIKPETD